MVPAYRINLDCICEILTLHVQPIKYLVGIVIIIKVQKMAQKPALHYQENYRPSPYDCGFFKFSIVVDALWFLCGFGSSILGHCGSGSMVLIKNLTISAVTKSFFKDKNCVLLFLCLHETVQATVVTFSSQKEHPVEEMYTIVALLYGVWARQARHVCTISTWVKQMCR
jgi:hypothetical protein